jgi:hypothetical protein
MNATERSKRHPDRVLLLGLLGAITLPLAGCNGEACQKTEGESFVTCAGSCPSSSRPECYVQFRREGSRDDWTKTGEKSFDKTPGMEWACYCDS